MRLESETAAILKKRPWLKLEPGYIRAVRTEHSGCRQQGRTWSKENLKRIKKLTKSQYALYYYLCTLFFKSLNVSDKTVLP